MERKNLAIIYAIIGLIVVSVFGLVFYYKIYNAEVNFIAIPENVKIFINNKVINGRKARLKPGRYKMAAEAEGFDRLEREIEVKAGSNQEKFYLSTNGDYYEKNKKMRDLAEKIDQDEVDANAERLIAKHPIIRVLPMKITPDDFEIDYVLEKDENLTLIVSRCEKIEEAKEHIEVLNIDVKKYKFICKEK